MSATRTLLHLVSVALLLLWSAVLLYFYATGRIAQYLPGDGIFRPMVLVSGIGLAVLALFNLLTLGAEDPGCEGHGHAHDGDCGHGHSHEDCGHDHANAGHQDCGHDHAHGHHHDCGHKHAHEDCDHDHAHACCGHDHAPGNAHSHGHGLLEESSWTGRLVAILILAAPITWAAFMTPDRYSANAVINKGLYNPNYSSTANADKFSLRTDDSAKTTATASTPAKPASPGAAPATEQAAVAKSEPQAQSYGSFTLDDLKAQVPQSKDGNFILEVPEIYYTGGDIEVQSVLAGQSVETIAQVLPEKVNNADGRRLRIFRMLVQCCAADARPYSIPVEFADKAPTYKDMTWIKIVGKMAYEKEGDQTVPVLKAEKVEETTEPENTMIY